MPYEWPGNVRELASVIERPTILARGDRLAIDAVVPKPERGARGMATRTSPERVLQTTEAAVAIETESERRVRAPRYAAAETRATYAIQVPPNCHLPARAS